MYKYAKRLIDIVISFVGIVVLAFPMIIIAIVIKCDSKGPALFKQKRLGKGKTSFTILKFRTMCNHAYEQGGIATSESDSRITKVGKFLRKTSLDELPQLINILIGQMSIIGPRPILDWEYYDNASEEYEPRFNVRPGMFCTVDLYLRATATREQQFHMDVEYVEHMNLFTDIRVFFGIIKIVITGKNVYKESAIENKVDLEEVKK